MTGRIKIIIAASVGFAILVLAIVGFTLQSQHGSQNEEVYADPSSGEKIIKSDNAPQGSEASLKNLIIYPGFSNLLERGLSPEEIQSIQATIAEYSLNQETRFEEVSLVVDSMRYIKSSENTEMSSLTFDLKVNRKDDYHMTVTPIDDETSVTKLYAADKTTLLIER